jgi:hypothetical protein
VLVPAVLVLPVLVPAVLVLAVLVWLGPALGHAGPGRAEGGPGAWPQLQPDRQVVPGQRAGRGPDQTELAAIADVAVHLPQRQRRRAGQLAKHAARLDDRGRPGDHAVTRPAAVAVSFPAVTAA